MQMPNRIDANNDLEKLFEAWGVNYDKTKVLANVGSNVPLPKLGSYPAWVRAIGENEITKNDFIPSDDLLLFMEAGAFSLSEDSNLTLTPLVQASTTGLLPASDLPRTQNIPTVPLRSLSGQSSLSHEYSPNICTQRQHTEGSRR